METEKKTRQGEKESERGGRRGNEIDWIMWEKFKNKLEKKEKVGVDERNKSK